MKQHDKFDLTEVYKNQIGPLVKEIKDICSTNKIPFFISFTIASDENGKALHKREGLTPMALKVEMTNCEIYPLICIATGSKAVIAPDAPEVEYN